MLRPQDSDTRERKSLNGLWQFRLDSEGEGNSARWFGQPLPDSSEMAVPASFNDIAADGAVRDYFGDVWYQTTVWVPRGWEGRRIVLHFESATHRATVWVNDVEVMSHEGGCEVRNETWGWAAGSSAARAIRRSRRRQLTTQPGRCTRRQSGS
jgi:beta-glucuronidase